MCLYLWRYHLPLSVFLQYEMITLVNFAFPSLLTSITWVLHLKESPLVCIQHSGVVGEDMMQEKVR